MLKVTIMAKILEKIMNPALPNGKQKEICKEGGGTVYKTQLKILYTTPSVNLHQDYSSHKV